MAVQCNNRLPLLLLPFFYQLAVPTVLVFRSGNCRQKAKDSAVPWGKGQWLQMTSAL